MAARRNVMLLDSQLLEHEQLHFDIAEVAARRIRKRFEEFTHACGEPGGLEPIQAMVATIDRELRGLGYQHVTIDLRGYRLGSLNEALRLRPV